MACFTSWLPEAKMCYPCLRNVLLPLSRDGHRTLSSVQFCANAPSHERVWGLLRGCYFTMESNLCRRCEMLTLLFPSHGQIWHLRGGAGVHPPTSSVRAPILGISFSEKAMTKGSGAH